MAINNFAIISKQSFKVQVSQSGSAIVETLISMVLLSLVIASSSKMIIYSMHSNTAARTFGSLMSDIQGTIDDYRDLTFNSLLNYFGSNHTAITNNQTVQITTTSKASRAKYTVTLTAMKTSSTGIPEAVKISVAAQQRRGLLGTASYDYETVIANAS